MSSLLGYFWLGEERKLWKTRTWNGKINPGERADSHCISASAFLLAQLPRECRVIPGGVSEPWGSQRSFPTWMILQSPEIKPLVPHPLGLPAARDQTETEIFCLKLLVGNLWGFQWDLFHLLKATGMLMGCTIWDPTASSFPSCGADHEPTRLTTAAITHSSTGDGQWYRGCIKIFMISPLQEYTLICKMIIIITILFPF